MSDKNLFDIGLTLEQVKKAFQNALNSVTFSKAQGLTDEQKAEARENIGALAETELEEAIEYALTQAKESGEFDGKDYVLTDDDKAEIAEVVYGRFSRETWTFTLADGSTVEKAVALL